MKTFKEYINEESKEYIVRIKRSDEPDDEIYDEFLEYIEKNLGDNSKFEEGVDDDFKFYEYIIWDKKELKVVQDALTQLKIKFKTEVKKVEPTKDLSKMSDDEKVEALFQSMVTIKYAVEGDDYYTYKFGTANGSIWIEGYSTEIADFNKKETYLGLTYTEVVKICKASNAIQAKRRK